MRQRVMIAMAMICRPRLLVADEPTTALDVTLQRQVLSLMGELKTELETAMLLITHDLGVVAQTAGRVAVMYAGRVVETANVGPCLPTPCILIPRGCSDPCRCSEQTVGGCMKFAAGCRPPRTSSAAAPLPDAVRQRSTGAGTRHPSWKQFGREGRLAVGCSGISELRN